MYKIFNAIFSEKMSKGDFKDLVKLIKNRNWEEILDGEVNTDVEDRKIIIPVKYLSDLHIKDGGLIRNQCDKLYVYCKKDSIEFKDQFNREIKTQNKVTVLNFFEELMNIANVVRDRNISRVYQKIEKVQLQY